VRDSTNDSVPGSPARVRPDESPAGHGRADPSQPSTTRRGVIVAGVGATGAALALAACGTAPASSGASGGDSSADPASPNAGGGASPAGQPGGNTALAKTSDIPVGGGKVFADQQVVVTQPAAGSYKAFTAICTHQGCTVNKIADGTIQCPCHGSQYSIADGSVKTGPATKALAAKNVTIKSGQVFLA
jgi:Rieske Fe-S protein